MESDTARPPVNALRKRCLACGREQPASGALCKECENEINVKSMRMLWTGGAVTILILFTARIGAGLAEWPPLPVQLAAGSVWLTLSVVAGKFVKYTEGPPIRVDAIVDAWIFGEIAGLLVYAPLALVLHLFA